MQTDCRERKLQQSAGVILRMVCMKSGEEVFEGLDFWCA